MKKNYQCDSYYICIYLEGARVHFLLSHNPKLTLFYLNNQKGIKEIRYLEPRLRLGEAKLFLDKLAKRFPVGSKGIFWNLSFSAKVLIILKRIITKFRTTNNNKLTKIQSNNIIFTNTKEIGDIASKLLKELGGKLGVRHDEIKIRNLLFTEIKDEIYHKPIPRDLDNIVSILDGRQLYQGEIFQGINEIGTNINGPLPDILHWLQLNDVIEIIPSIEYTDKYNLRCQRCGQTDKIHQMECIDCGAVCDYCENCVSMGEARSCKPLFRFKETKFKNKKYHDEFNARSKDSVIDIFCNDKEIVLTKAQRDAYDKLCEFVDSKYERALIIAVCGAGKTEIVFGAILKALKNGQRILFAIPRKDVVLELYPRLNKYFNQYSVLPLYGGCPKKYTSSKLVIATTHQTLRFREAFDLVILDEVDAFPYKDSEMLYYAVERAKKKSGKIIYMTATPDKKLLSRSNEKGWQRVTISARYHGYPLPVPEIIIEKDKSKNSNFYSNNSNKYEGTISTTVWEFIKRSVLDDMVQLFIFVPSIDIAEKVGELIAEEIEIRGIGTRDWVQYSHSKDHQREKKRQGFSRGDFPVLISTTIMERGITVPKANVLVLFSHWEKIFDQGTLIQMAGRAGRSKEYPEGKVIFFGEKVTDAMSEAKKIIINLNKQAAKMGYIKMEEE